MSTFLHKNVLITGGAGRIGRLIAEKVLQEGAARVVIWDLDRAGLQRVTESLTERNVQVYGYTVDLREPEQIYTTADLVMKEVGSVDILFNNAGIVTGKPFTEQSPDEIESLIEINLLGALHTTRAFLPEMKRKKSGHIVNISSAASLLANPKMSVYAGSKWALTGWGESLRLEIESGEGDLHLTTIQPSYINTGMFAGIEPPMLTPVLEPEYIVRKIISAVKKNKIVVREPFMVKLIPFLKGILPIRILDFVAGKIFRVYRSMDTFEGGRSPRPGSASSEKTAL